MRAEEGQVRSQCTELRGRELCSQVPVRGPELADHQWSDIMSCLRLSQFNNVRCSATSYKGKYGSLL